VTVLASKSSESIHTMILIKWNLDKIAEK